MLVDHDRSATGELHGRDTPNELEDNRGDGRDQGETVSATAKQRITYKC